MNKKFKIDNKINNNKIINKTLTIAIMLCLLFIATACAKSGVNNVPPPTTNPTPTNNLAGYHECTNPRPQICTMEYMPVCGISKDGNKTYATGCTACANADVIGYIQSACPVDEDQNVVPPNETNPKPIGGDTDAGGCLIGAGYSWCEAKQKCLRPWEENCTSNYTECKDPRQQACTREYVPVCGKFILNTGVTTYQTFGNKCDACATMKVVGYTQGECKENTNDLYVTCTNPRQQACTREYMPVCATKDNGIRCIKAPCPSTNEITYDNKCTACADSKVYGYVPGECKTA